MPKKDEAEYRRDVEELADKMTAIGGLAGHLAEVLHALLARDEPGVESGLRALNREDMERLMLEFRDVEPLRKLLRRVLNHATEINSKHKSP